MVKVRGRLGVSGCSSVVSKTAAVKRVRVSARARRAVAGWSRCVHERGRFGASCLSRERGLRCSDLTNVGVHFGAGLVGATLTMLGQSTGIAGWIVSAGASASKRDGPRTGRLFQRHARLGEVARRRSLASTARWQRAVRCGVESSPTTPRCQRERIRERVSASAFTGTGPRANRTRSGALVSVSGMVCAAE